MRKTIIALTLLLAGCNSTQSVPEAPVIKFDPNELTPVTVFVPTFYVLTPENALQLLNEKKVLIAMSYDDSIELNKSFVDISVYVDKQNETIKLRKK